MADPPSNFQHHYLSSSVVITPNYSSHQVPLRRAEEVFCVLPNFLVPNFGCLASLFMAAFLSCHLQGNSLFKVQYPFPELWWENSKSAKEAEVTTGY